MNADKKKVELTSEDRALQEQLEYEEAHPTETLEKEWNEMLENKKIKAGSFTWLQLLDPESSEWEARDFKRSLWWHRLMYVEQDPFRAPTFLAMNLAGILATYSKVDKKAEAKALWSLTRACKHILGFSIYQDNPAQIMKYGKTVSPVKTAKAYRSFSKELCSFRALVDYSSRESHNVDNVKRGQALYEWIYNKGDLWQLVCTWPSEIKANNKGLGLVDRVSGLVNMLHSLVLFGNSESVD